VRECSKLLWGCFLAIQIGDFETKLLKISIAEVEGGRIVHQVIHIVQRSERSNLYYLNVEIEVFPRQKP